MNEGSDSKVRPFFACRQKANRERVIVFSETMSEGLRRDLFSGNSFDSWYIVFIDQRIVW